MHPKAQNEARDSTQLVSDFKNLSKLWPYLQSNKRYIIAATVLIPLILICHTALPMVLKTTIDDGILKSDPNFIAMGALVYISLTILEYILRGAQTLSLTISIHRMIKLLRKTLIEHILHLSPKFHDSHLSGALVTRATSDFDNMSESLNQGILSSVVDIAVVIGALGGLFLLDVKLAISITLTLPLVYFIVVIFSTTLKKTMLSARSKVSILNSYIQECLYGSSTIKTLGAEHDAINQTKLKAIAYRNTQMKSVILDASMFAILDGIASIAIGLILWVSVTPFLNPENTTNITPGILVAAIAYITNLYDPIKHLSNKIALLQGTFAAIDRIFGLLDTKDFVKGKESLKTIKGEISFSQVGFSYDRSSITDKNKPILHNISFHIPKNGSLAIVGPTGSGKSTIIKLLTKLYDHYDGVITIDGNDLRNISPTTLNQQIGTVPQDITLFEGSVGFNISLGLPGITQEDIERASKFVGADKFIEDLPGKYDFIILEQGANLSQGQRQLIAFARALAKRPQLMILDEATASVDPESERIIQRTIKTIMNEMTVIIIAHRLSTIQHCDNILVLSQGEINQQGSHTSLISKKGIYQQLIENLN